MTEPMKSGGPSYLMSAVGGLFLGILGAALMILFPEEKWIPGVAPVFCLFAGILGTYVAAEPYEELKSNYDKMADDFSKMVSSGQVTITNELAPAMEKLKDEIDKEGVRLTKVAAERGDDGVELAKAAEFLRQLWKKCDEFKGSK